MPTSGKQLFLARLKKTLKKRSDVYVSFLSGSCSQKKDNILSDIDLWVIFREEHALNQALHTISELFNGQGKIDKIKMCTPTHFFVFLRNKLQIDLNLSTAAEYHSLLSNEKDILFDATPEVAQASKSEAAEIYFHGIKILERTVGKYKGGNYVVIPRFLNALRDEVLIPLLAPHTSLHPTSLINLQINSLPTLIRVDFLSTFAQPTKESCRQAIVSAISLIEFLKNDYPNIYKQEKNRVKIMKSESKKQLTGKKI